MLSLCQTVFKRRLQVAFSTHIIQAYSTAVAIRKPALGNAINVFSACRQSITAKIINENWVLIKKNKIAIVHDLYTFSNYIIIINVIWLLLTLTLLCCFSNTMHLHESAIFLFHIHYQFSRSGLPQIGPYLKKS